MRLTTARMPATQAPGGDVWGDYTAGVGKTSYDFLVIFHEVGFFNQSSL